MTDSHQPVFAQWSLRVQFVHTFCCLERGRKKGVQTPTVWQVKGAATVCVFQ